MEGRSELEHVGIRELFESLQVTGVPLCTTGVPLCTTRSQSTRSQDQNWRIITDHYKQEAQHRVELGCPEKSPGHLL